MLSFSLFGCHSYKKCTCLSELDEEKMSEVFGLSQKIYDEILEVYNQQNEQQIIWISHYFGEYNNAYVFESNSGLGAMIVTEFEVAGYLFTTPSTNINYEVYYEGDIFSLDEAYEEKILQLEDIEKIYNAYLDFYGGGSL